MNQTVLRYMAPKSQALQLKVVLIGALLTMTSCSEWSDSDKAFLNRLAIDIKAGPEDEKLIRLLEKGMQSDETLRACNYIQIGGQLADIPRAREILSQVVQNRTLNSNLWISRNCAEQLPILVTFSPNDYDEVIRGCLERTDSDIAWFAIEAIEALGAEGDRFTNDISDYLEAAVHFPNTTGANRGARALLNIGTKRALTVLASFSDESNERLKELALKAQNSLESKVNP